MASQWCGWEVIVWLHFGTRKMGTEEQTQELVNLASLVPCHAALYRGGKQNRLGVFRYLQDVCPNFLFFLSLWQTIGWPELETSAGVRCDPLSPPSPQCADSSETQTSSVHLIYTPYTHLCLLLLFSWCVFVHRIPKKTHHVFSSSSLIFLNGFLNLKHILWLISLYRTWVSVSISVGHLVSPFSFRKS